MTKQDFLNLGGKEWVKGDHSRVYIKADAFNELMGTSFGDNNNSFYFDCNSNKLMRSYKGKKPTVEVSY